MTEGKERVRHARIGNVVGPGGSPCPLLPILDALTRNKNKTTSPTAVAGGVPIILTQDKTVYKVGRPVVEVIFNEACVVYMSFQYVSRTQKGPHASLSKFHARNS